jgi:hypothetical protein
LGSSVLGLSPEGSGRGGNFSTGEGDRKEGEGGDGPSVKG